MSIKSFKLADGHSIPAIAFGAGTRWFKFDAGSLDTALVDATVKATNLGFTHIDSAEIYRTDNEVGEAIAKSGKARKDLFITDKYFTGIEKFGFKALSSNPAEALKSSLGRLKLDYVDLYLLHSQEITKESIGFDIVQAWKYLEELKDAGLAKSIGVSNFNVAGLKEILNSNPKYTPVVNQIEFSAHLQNQSPGVVEFCQSKGILVEAYSPLSPLTIPAKVGEDTQLVTYVTELAKKYGKNDSDIHLRWVYQRGILPVTTSGNEERLKGYLLIFDFELTEQEVQKIADLGKLRKVQKFAESAPPQ